MTTLPQTTPIRLPRPAGSSPLSAGGGGGGPAPGSGGGSFQMTPGDVWRVIRANLWLIVLLVGLAAVGGYFLNGYLVKHDSVYLSYGLARIRPSTPMDPLQGQAMIDGGSLEIAQATQSQMIHSDDLVDEILKEPDNPIRQSHWWRVTCGADPQKAHLFMGEHLSVDPMLGSETIRVGVTTPDPADAPLLVTAIIDQAIQHDQKASKDKDDARRQQIQELQATNQVLLDKVTDQVNELMAELSHGGGNAGIGVNPKDMELEHQFGRNLQLQNDKVTADNAYDTFRAELAAGEVPARVQAMVDQDREVSQYRAEVDSMDVAIALDPHLPDSPQLQQMQRQREIFQQRETDAERLKTAQFSKGVLSELDGTRHNVAKMLEMSDKQVSDLKESVADLGNKYQQFVNHKEEQATFRRKEDEFRDTLLQMNEKSQMADFGSLAWFVRPLQPTTPSFPNLKTTVGGCVVAGLVLGLGIAFLRELTDTTVRSPRDIVRVGQLAVLGMVPHEADDPQASGARLPLVIYEAPGSIMAEQLRQVRTRLQHAASLDTTRSILVTSAAPGDGKTTVAVNLAAGLALNGRRILLIDANFRRPELHKVFGIDNAVGFSDVLDDVNTFAAAVRETSVPNLSVMPTGAKPNNPTELLESQLLIDAVERALEEYDHVVFDSGPLLIVSESVALAPRVDGVVTVVRARSSSRGVLLRLRDTLRQVRAEHLGVVLNGVRTQAGGYYGRSIKSYYDYQSPA